MKEEFFDHIIKQKLENFRVEYQPEDWELLEQQLDGEMVGTPEETDNQLDEVFFDKLHRLEVPYNAKHWAQMSSRLDLEFASWKRILLYKAMELSLFLLLIFTISQYLPTENSSGTPLYNSVAGSLSEEPTTGTSASVATPEATLAPATQIAETDLKGSTGTLLSEKEEIIEQAERPTKSGSSTDIENTAISVRQEASLPTLPPKIENVTRDRSAAETETPEIILTEASTRNHAVLSAIHTLPIPLLDESKNPAILRALLYKTLAESSPSSIGKMKGLLAALDQKPVYELTYSKKKKALAKPLKRKHHTRIGMFGSIDYNRVATPPSEVYAEGFERYALGYSGGISLGFEFGRWEFGSGLIYTAKQYTPIPVIFVHDGNFRDGYEAEGIKNIELNIVNIPLDVRFNFYKRNKWRLYATTGLSVQVATKANYYRANQDGFRSLAFNPAPAPDFSGVGQRSSPPPAFESISEGLFEGGSFEENAYFTGNVGLGMEKYFDGRLSFFVQPTLQMPITYLRDGWGPFQDRIHSLSIYTGLKIRLPK